MLKGSSRILVGMGLALAISGCFMRSGARGVYHTVRPGETLSSIARVYRTNYQELAEINNIQNPSNISAGQRIFVPHARRQRDSRGSVRGGDSQEKLEFIRTRFSWPLTGPVTSPFGIRGGRKHDGIDIAASSGTEVQAADDGKVVYAQKLRGYGNLILIKHSGDYFTAYAHNQVNLAREGKKIKKGDVIARVGSSGRAKGPHLHFEIRQGKKARNPLFLLPEAPVQVAARETKGDRSFIRKAHAKTKKAKANRRRGRSKTRRQR